MDFIQFRMDKLLLSVVLLLLMFKFIYIEGCLFGPGCAFPCRCESGDCDQQTGVCASACQKGFPSGINWQGPGCQQGNVAYGKTAWQMGMVKPEWGALQAVDGVVSGDNCAHPAGSGQGWWMVDLGRMHRVTQIIFSNTIKSSASLAKDLQFFVSNRSIPVDTEITDFTGFSLCDQQSIIGRSENKHIVCRSPLVGQYVLIYKNSTDVPGAFVACEVTVIGNIYIPCDDCRSECNDWFGCIPNCPEGKNQTTFCTKDCDGGYGFHCKRPCSGHCKKEPCHPVDGTCSQGCEEWWTGDRCDVEIVQMGEDVFPLGKIEQLSSTSTSLTVSWLTMSNIAADKAKYYGIEAMCFPEPVDDVPFRMDRIEVPYSDAIGHYNVTFHNLTVNTLYHVKIRPFRRHLRMADEAKFSLELVTRTDCVLPDRPIIKNVMAFNTTNAVQSVNVTYEKAAKTGCENLILVQIEYSDGRAWKESNVTDTSRGYHVFTPRRPGFYAVKVKVTNNGGLSAISHVLTVFVEGEAIEDPDEDGAKGNKDETNGGTHFVSGIGILVIFLIIPLLS